MRNFMQLYSHGLVGLSILADCTVMSTAMDTEAENMEVEVVLHYMKFIHVVYITYAIMHYIGILS